LDSYTHITIETHEFYLYVFDAAPMFLALLIFNLYHPGRVLIGPESEYPKLTKEEKKMAKEEKKRLKEKKQSKRERKSAGVNATELVSRDVEETF